MFLTLEMLEKFLNVLTFLNTYTPLYILCSLNFSTFSTALRANENVSEYGYLVTVLDDYNKLDAKSGDCIKIGDYYYRAIKVHNSV